MNILTKSGVIYGTSEEKSYFRLQNNGYYIPCNLAKATHIKVDGELYSVQEYRLFDVGEIPEGLETEGTWVYEEDKIYEKADLKSDLLRKKRDSLLTECDWAITPDSPLGEDTKVKVMEYRQKLRDIPQQEGFPFGIVLPASPLVHEE